MAVHDEYCLVCGGPTPGIDLVDLGRQVLTGECSTPLAGVQPKVVVAALRALDASFAWARHWVGVDSDERQWDLGEYDEERGDFRLAEHPQGFRLEGSARSSHAGYNRWRVRMGREPLSAMPLHDGPSGLAFHRSCALVLDAELGYRPSFARLIDRLRDGRNRDGNLVAGIDYGPIVTCFGQDFDYVKAVVDGIAWTLRDPLVDARSRDRVVAMWRQFLSLPD